ncbi:hypothetical protein N9R54_01985 [Pelobium sp.]|nr:PepSY-like domain-containing protein [Pelobium sp.]MDA9554981.1 hypothetical protein [Pelobium sp.]
MKTITKISTLLSLSAMIAIGFTSCKKNADISTDTSALASQLGAVAVTPSSSILNVTATASTSTQDSVYAMDACRRDHKRTSVTKDALSSAINIYLNTNYAGYTFIKAFSTTLISTNTVDSYVVAFLYNNKPVAIRFDASGNFVKVLELREGRDLGRPGGHHDGGCFEDRDGRQRDSIALSLLPNSIKQYFATTYPQDTLKSAWIAKEGAIIVLSKNVTYFGNAFKLDGTFIKREVLPSPLGKGKEITQDKLPATALTYLSTTYPNYVFKKAFEHSLNGVVKGYAVIIDANLTKYAVIFDASGAFVAVKTVR